MFNNTHILIIERGRRRTKRSSIRSTWEETRSFRKSFEEGNVFFSQYDQVSSRYRSHASLPGKRDLIRERRALLSNLRTMMGDPSKESLVRNALWAESYRVMGARELADMGEIRFAPENPIPQTRSLS